MNKSLIKNVQVILPDLKITELFVEAKAITEKLGLSTHTLQTLRTDGSFIKGIHYTEVNSRLILYNLPLIVDWLVNRHDPNSHQRAIEIFQSSLLSNRRRSKKKS